MKKIILSLMLVIPFVANADMYREEVNTCDAGEMRAALDRASADKRAVITIVECDNGVVRTTTKSAAKPAAKPVAASCGCGCEEKQEVVKREYFVRETVQTYKPVIQYVPSGTYTRVKPACNHGC